MFVINSVTKITRDSDGSSLIVECNISTASGDDAFDAKHAYRDDDPHGLSPVIKQWIADHPDFPIDPYVAPEPLTPEELRAKMPPLTARQFRLGLVAGGKSPAQVDTAIAAMPEGADKETAKIEWEYATTFKRTHPLITTLGAALSLTPENIDTLWNNAVSL